MEISAEREARAWDHLERLVRLKGDARDEAALQICQSAVAERKRILRNTVDLTVRNYMRNTRVPGVKGAFTRNLVRDLTSKI